MSVNVRAEARLPIILLLLLSTSESLFWLESLVNVLPVFVRSIQHCQCLGARESTEAL